MLIVEFEYMKKHGRLYLSMEPTTIKQRKKLDRRLGIKSSMPNPERALAATYLIWKGAGEPDSLEYCDVSSDDQDTLKISDDLYARIEDYWKNIGSNVPSDFKEKIESSPLFSSQLEHLQVLMTLYWKLAKVSFIGEYHESKERTGGKRFLKKLEFTTNIDLIDLTLLSPEQENVNADTFQFLLAWLKGNKQENLVEKKIKKHLMILSEDTWFRNADTTFLQEGIYDSLKKNGSPINFTGELKGPLRILNTVVSKGFHLALENSGTGFTFKEDTDENYLIRVSNLLDIQEVNSGTNITKQGAKIEKENISEYPRNLILYGAPGTGKSYKLKNRINILKPSNYERVTFYSDYSYAQFIGGYRPVPVYVQKNDEIVIVKNQENRNLNRPGKPAIEYSFVAGPLLRLYVEAKKNPEKIYLLVIEELNRADAAAVFGDFFQLLDRKVDGTSEYETQLSKDAKEYLDQEFQDHLDLKGGAVCLPANLYIWATLNSADQGVFPIDTAFKRRWEFEYLPLNENESIVADKKITLKIENKETGENIEILWNDLRHKINQKLSDIGIQEDLMIGPFFLSPQEMTSDKAFKYKLLSYLRDDILRHQYHDFFSLQSTLDKIIQAYENGENIFNFEIN